MFVSKITFNYNFLPEVQHLILLESTFGSEAEHGRVLSGLNVIRILGKR